MPSTVLEVSSTADRDAATFRCSVDGKLVPAFPVTVNLVPGPDPSTAEIECPLNGPASVDDEAQGGGYAFLRWWFGRTYAGQRVIIYCQQDGKSFPVLIGSVVRTRHGLGSDIGVIEVADDRWLMAGVPIVGRFIYDPNPSSQKDIAEGQAAMESTFRTVNDKDRAWRKSLRDFKTGASSISEVRAAKTELESAQAAFTTAKSDMAAAEESAKAIFYSERQDPIFNEFGFPNCYMHPVYGPIFCVPNMGLGKASTDYDYSDGGAGYGGYGSSPGESYNAAGDVVGGDYNPVSGETAEYWTIGKAFQYLRNVYASSSFKATSKEALQRPLMSKANDFKWFHTLNAHAMEWPYSLAVGHEQDVANLGIDRAFAQAIKDNNNKAEAADARLPICSLKGLYLNQALSKLAQLVGAYDIFLDCGTTYSSEQDAQWSQSNGNDVAVSQVGKAASILDGGEPSEPKATLTLVRTAFSPKFTAGTYDITVCTPADVDDTTRPCVLDGTVEQDARNSFNSVVVRAAPIMLETTVLFLPTAGSSYNMDTGVITWGAGTTTLDDIPADCTFIPSWSRQYRKYEGATPAEAQQTAGEEYAFLNYMANCHATLKNTTEAYRMACIKYPRPFTCFRIKPKNWYSGTRYDGMKTPNNLLTQPLAFLLSYMGEFSQGSTYRRLPYPVVVETYDNFDDGWRWQVGTVLESIEVDRWGNIWLPVLRDMSLSNVHPYAGTWKGTVWDPLNIQAKPLRLTIAFPFDHNLTEAIDLGVEDKAEYTELMDGIATAVSKTSVDSQGNSNDGSKRADPLGQAKLFASGFKRQYLADVGDAYREYLRKDSWAIPRTAYTDGVEQAKQEDKYTAGNELLSQREEAARHAVYALERMSRVYKPGDFLFDDVMLYRPGVQIGKIVSTDGQETLINSVIKRTQHDGRHGRSILGFQ